MRAVHVFSLFSRTGKAKRPKTFSCYKALTDTGNSDEMDGLACFCPKWGKCFAVIVTLLLLGITILWNKKKLPQIVHKQIDKLREDLDNPYSAPLLGENVVYNITIISSSVTSSVHLMENRKYAVGERVRVFITLRDQLGRQKTSGGDFLRVWLQDKSLKANVAGDVIDNGNGTYTGSNLLPWKGRPKLYVSIAIPREINLLIEHTKVKNLGSVYILDGMFNKTSHGPSEITKCGPQPMTEQTSLCNLTRQNYDLDWYCKAPTTHGITCKDWKMAIGKGLTYLSNKDKAFITKYQHRKLQQTLDLQVEGDNELMFLNDTPCHLWPKEDSWNARPSGFYYKSRWKNTCCKITNQLPIPRYKRCFANRHLLLIGDSNIRMIGMSIIKGMNLKLLKGNPTSHIPQDVLAYNKTSNITLWMFPHQLPYYAQRFMDKNVFVSAAKRLDDIPAGDNRVILIHLWMHMIRISVHSFRHHVRKIRQAIERLLRRSPNVHISIKGPHAFTYRDQMPADYIALQHIRIWWEEFSDLHKQVIFLNEWGRTVGNENIDVHPNCFIDLIHNFLGHVCDPAI